METIVYTVETAVKSFREELQEHFSDSELEQTLQITFYHYFKLSRIDLTLKKDDLITETNFKQLKEVIVALKAKMPLAHIIGEWEFYGLSLMVNEHTLIPRPETEELVKLIVEENVKEEPEILDIGTGSGCIPLALKQELPKASLNAYDVSEEALKVAQENSKNNNLDVVFKNVNILTIGTGDVNNKFV